MNSEIVSLSMRTPSWFLIPVGTLPSILYSYGPSSTRRSALLTNILALSFSHNALSLLKIDSFKTGCVLLSGLFLYDIWWVFGTEVVSQPLPALNSFTSDDILSDGKSGDHAGRPDQTSVAQVVGVFHRKGLHNAGLGRHRCSGFIHSTCAALRLPPIIATFAA